MQWSFGLKVDKKRSDQHWVNKTVPSALPQDQLTVTKWQG